MKESGNGIILLSYPTQRSLCLPQNSRRQARPRKITPRNRIVAIAVLVALAGCARDFDMRKGRVVYGPPKPGEVIDAIPKIETGDDGGGDGGGGGGHGD